MRIVPLKHGSGLAVAERFNKSAVYVSRCLTFKRNTMQAREIRHYVMNVLGGVVM